MLRDRTTPLAGRPTGDRHGSLTQRLTGALRDRWESLDRTSFRQALEAHTLPLGGYCDHLQAWLAVWSEVEAQGAADPLGAYTPEMAFAGLLHADLAYLNPLAGEREPDCLYAAEAAARHLRASFKAERVTFLGALYAFGYLATQAAMHDENARLTFGLSLSGRAFWRYQVMGAQDRWVALAARLDALPGNGPVADRIEAAARATASLWLDVERSIRPGTSLAPHTTPVRTPPGVAPSRPGLPAWGILRGGPHSRRPR